MTDENTINFECENVIIKVTNDILDKHKYGYYFLKHPEKVVVNEKFKRTFITKMINDEFIDKNKNILDCGAFMGDNSIPLSKLINGFVYAIDPSEKNTELISNISKYNQINNIIPYTFALSNSEETLFTTGEIEHCVFNSNNGNENSYNPPHGMKHGTKITNTGLCESYRIDTLVDNGKISNCSLLHLDAEGYEKSIILSGLKLINNEQPIIIWENHTDTFIKNTRNLEFIDIINLLKKKNYITYIFKERGSINPYCRNFISIPINKFKLFNSKYSEDIKNKNIEVVNV